MLLFVSVFEIFSSSVFANRTVVFVLLFLFLINIQVMIRKTPMICTEIAISKKVYFRERNSSMSSSCTEVNAEVDVSYQISMSIAVVVIFINIYCVI